ncbi:MAG: hypothetical protein IJ535_12760 [Pseudobutyrivibrio sp.]|uniref:hypothetical protein n=1 Tax=Pseudobutyrivibrio sp. TaxID=2014367 RepID=UPI0025E98560|nr:hypothetical protein [Pseudobutyrivibrio sp.]MBQ8490643.1 hypothetical protein [Pseudobutyrivibrio sp.]
MSKNRLFLLIFSCILLSGCSVSSNTRFLDNENVDLNTSNIEESDLDTFWSKFSTVDYDEDKAVISGSMYHVQSGNNEDISDFYVYELFLPEDDKTFMSLWLNAAMVQKQDFEYGSNPYVTSSILRDENINAIYIFNIGPYKYLTKDPYDFQYTDVEPNEIVVIGLIDDNICVLDNDIIENCDNIMTDEKFVDKIVSDESIIEYPSWFIPNIRNYRFEFVLAKGVNCLENTPTPYKIMGKLL